MKVITFLKFVNVCILILIGCESAFAQERVVTGTVMDGSSGNPLPGVNVVVKNTTQGAVTDANGIYSLNIANEEAVLVFSFIGFAKQEESVGTRSTINVTLQPDVASLEEVVVVGYATQRKRDVTGSIAQVKPEAITAVSGSNPIQALQGRAPGVAVMSNNSPGSSPTLRIRGSGSINANNDPLYVVDGFPLMNSNLNDINPNDIISIEILKDASSAAIYGSRGANGVVLITTKKGESGTTNLSYSSYVGIQSPERLVEMLDRDEFIEFINEGYEYANGRAVYSSSNPAPNFNTDWQDAIMKDKAIIQEHSLIFDGGNDRTNYMLSAGVFSQGGLVAASGFEKYTLRSNLKHEFKKWLTVGTNLQLSNTKRDVRSDPTGNIFRFGWPTIPIRNADNSWYYPSRDPSHAPYFEGNYNPVSDAEEVTDELVRSRILGDVYAEFSITPDLKFRTNFGLDLINEKGYNYLTSLSSGGINTGTGSGGQTFNKSLSKLTENILTYSHTWNNSHRLTATGVYSYQDFTFERLGISGSGFTNDVTGAYDMSLANQESVSWNSTKFDNKLISWTTRLSYSYKDKYMLTATGRYDGSSRFGENNKWGLFPSLGLGWRIGEEAFLQDNALISDLKLRASYGVTGNQEISNYASLPQLQAVYYNFDNMLLQGFAEQIGNPDLRWEKTTQFDIGVDVTLWDRIDVTLDYYNRITEDLLYAVPIPTTSGFSSILDNIGGVKNEGFEFSIQGLVIDRGFKWEMAANVSSNNNEITKLYRDVEKVNLGSSPEGFARFLVVGQPVNSIWARESAGIIGTQEQLETYRTIVPSANLGEEMYIDHSGDNSIGVDDYINIGTPVPKFFYGLSSNFKFKNFSLDVYGQGAYDYASVAGISQSVFGDSPISIGYASNTGSYLMFGENQILNRVYLPSKYAHDRMWSDSNPDGTFPRAGARGTYFSDRTNGGWNYFLIKTIKLGYDFSSLVKGVNWVQGLTIYVNAQNYVNFANHRGYNPENGDVTYPWGKVMIFGINARF